MELRFHKSLSEAKIYIYIYIYIYKLCLLHIGKHFFWFNPVLFTVHFDIKKLSILTGRGGNNKQNSLLKEFSNIFLISPPYPLWVSTSPWDLELEDQHSLTSCVIQGTWLHFSLNLCFPSPASQLLSGWNSATTLMARTLLSCSLIHPQDLEQSLVLSRHSVNIC